MAALWLVPWVPAGAQTWSVQNSVQTRFESNSNYQLSSQPGRRANQWQLLQQASAARETEGETTRVDTGLSAYQFLDGTAPSRIDGRLTASQSWRRDRDLYALGLQFVQDTTLDSELRDTGVVLTRGRRRQGAGSASWTHQLTPRTALQGELALSSVRYGRQPASGSNYRYRQLGGVLSHALTEVDKLELVVGFGRYDNASAGVRSRTRDLRLAWTRRWSERMQTNAGYGRYSVATTVEQGFLRCPVDPIVCALGLVDFEPTLERSDLDNRGRQYLFSWRYKPQESSDLEARVVRQVAPSGAGTVVESRSGALNLSRQWLPTLRGGLDYSIAESRALGAAGGPYSRYQSAGLFVSQSLSPDLYVDAGWRRTRSDDLNLLTRAVSDVAYVALRYDGLRWQPAR